MLCLISMKTRVASTLGTGTTQCLHAGNNREHNRARFPRSATTDSHDRRLHRHSGYPTELKLRRPLRSCHSTSIQRPGPLYADEDPVYIDTATYNTHNRQLDFEVWPANIFRDVLTPWPGGIQPTHYSTELAKHVFGHTRWPGAVHRKSFGVTHGAKHQFNLFHMEVVCSCTRDYFLCLASGCFLLRQLQDEAWIAMFAS
jgi:hypothetical protein